LFHKNKFSVPLIFKKMLFRKDQNEWSLVNFRLFYVTQSIKKGFKKE